MALLATAVLLSCDIAPQEINYHQDECAFCKMKISDSRFGAELVTKKGKVYKYDSAECLFATLTENSPNDYSYILVTDFTSPGELIDAVGAAYLISPGRPSPMGGDLSAYADSEDAQNAQEKLGGLVFNFDSVLNKSNAAK